MDRAPTNTRTAGGLDFTARGGKRQGREVPRSLRVKPGAKPPVWETQSRFYLVFDFLKKRPNFLPDLDCVNDGNRMSQFNRIIAIGTNKAINIIK